MLSQRWAFVVVLMSAALSISASTSVARAEVVDRIVALVNDRVITLNELKRLTLPLEMRLQSIPNPFQRSKVLREQTQIALDQLIGALLLKEIAQEQGIKISDEQVEAEVQAMLKAQRWGEAQFQGYLREQGMTREDFYSQYRDMLIQREVAKRNLPNKFSASEIELQSEYRSLKSEAKTQAQVEGAHLFLQVPSGSTPAREAAIQQRARELFSRAQTGEDFTGLVREFGEGANAKRGGGLGLITRGGGLPKELEDAFLTMSEGEIKGPVRSPFGYHILKVTQLTVKPLPSFEAIKPQLKEQLRQRKYQKALNAWIEELKGSAFIERRL